MTARSYQCSCGWSVHQWDGQADAEFDERVHYHEQKHREARRILAENP